MKFEWFRTGCCSPSIQLHPFNWPSSRPWLKTWSTTMALISWGICLCLWPLIRLPIPFPAHAAFPLLFFLAVDPVHFLVGPLLPETIVLCSYVLATWSFMRCKKKSNRNVIRICLTDYENWFNRFACNGSCTELMSRCCGGLDYSTENQCNTLINMT